MKLFHLLPAINNYFTAHITILPQYRSYSLSLCWIFFLFFLLPFNCCHHLTAGSIQSQSNCSVLFSLPKWPNFWHVELTDRKMACISTLTENVPIWCSDVMNKQQICKGYLLFSKPAILRCYRLCLYVVYSGWPQKVQFSVVNTDDYLLILLQDPILLAWEILE